MKTLIPLVLAVLFPLSLAHSAVTAESVKASNAAGFGQAQALPQKAFKAQKYVTVSGYVNLSGMGFVFGDNGGFVSVNVSGSGNFTGEGGRVQTNYTSISQTASFYLAPNQNFVSQYVNVNQYVGLYCDGKYVGSTNITGGVNLSGWKSGNSINVNGSGMLSGSAFVDCGDDQPNKRTEPELPGHAVPAK